MFSSDNLLVFNENQEKYIRHLNLPLIKIQGQQRILSSRILFIGAGGLASSSLLYLAAAGVGTIGIIDDDVVDISNLQRQVIHDENSIGMLKAKSAREVINKLNKNCKVIIYLCKLNSDNALKIMKNYNLIIDCTDNIKTRNIIDNGCSILNLPYVYGAISQFVGHISVLHFQNDLSYSDIMCGNNNIKDCNNSGVLSLLPGMIGLFQSSEVIKIILGIPNSLSKSLMIYSVLDIKLQNLLLKKKKKDLSKRRYKIKNDYEQQNSFNDIKKILSSQHLIIDIRDSYTSMIRPIHNAINIQIDNLINDTSLDFIKSKAIDYSIYVYCDDELKTNLAIKLLKKHQIQATKYYRNVNSYR
uniref:Molybdopterin biosynthesis protein n=1 Tax=Porphyridium sordidum TaxID=28024 RepID=A0A1C9CDN7_PORSO|nr:molybdopterin biosynthesis protein [Porphyridium sordidum]AOM66482.1 molybdopterin biosynthesis protein [Porphyridium sordidum]